MPSAFRLSQRLSSRSPVWLTASSLANSKAAERLHEYHPRAMRQRQASHLPDERSGRRKKDPLLSRGRMHVDDVMSGIRAGDGKRRKEGMNLAVGSTGPVKMGCSMIGRRTAFRLARYVGTYLATVVVAYDECVPGHCRQAEDSVPVLCSRYISLGMYFALLPHGRTSTAILGAQLFPAVCRSQTNANSPEAALQRSGPSDLAAGRVRAPCLFVRNLGSAGPVGATGLCQVTSLGKHTRQVHYPSRPRLSKAKRDRPPRGLATRSTATSHVAVSGLDRNLPDCYRLAC